MMRFRVTSPGSGSGFVSSDFAGVSLGIRDSNLAPFQSTPLSSPNLGSIRPNAFRVLSRPVHYPDGSIRIAPTTLEASRSRSDGKAAPPRIDRPHSCGRHNTFPRMCGAVASRIASTVMARTIWGGTATCAVFLPPLIRQKTEHGIPANLHGTYSRPAPRMFSRSSIYSRMRSATSAA